MSAERALRYANKRGLGALGQLSAQLQRVAEQIINAQAPQPRDLDYAAQKRQEVLEKAKKPRSNSLPPHST